MLTLWKTLIQSKLDYCFQLWSPNDQGSISKLESVARNFTSQITGCESQDYWERLSSLKMYSQERRRERYEIIFIWKILQDFVEGYPLHTLQHDRRGRTVQVSPYHPSAPAPVRKAREASLSVKGAKLFNTLPRGLRDILTGTVDIFKRELVAGLRQYQTNLQYQGGSGLQLQIL